MHQVWSERGRGHGDPLSLARDLAILLPALLINFIPPAALAEDKVPLPYFGIRVVDEETGRGVPLVELRTVNDVVHVTDGAGWAAFHEPGLMDREVFFAVKSPGYEYPKDGFGFVGARLQTTPGTVATIKVKRTNVAQRLCRLTGQGIYRDSTLLGLATPSARPNDNGGVLGQDSVQAVPYRGRLFWLWGDTNLAGYPLGNFHVTAATTPLPGHPGARPEVAIDFDYFMDPDRPERVRKMAPLEGPGVVWLFGLLTITDDQGKEALVAHYVRMKSLAEMLEQGMVRFDDDAGVFKKIATFDLKNDWRHPRYNAVRVTDADGDYFYFAAPFCHTRVRAAWSDLLDPSKYEALAFDPLKKEYAWRRDADPTTQADERKLVKEGKMPASAARHQLTDAATGKPVTLHGGSIGWNAHRQKWLLIGLQAGDRDSPSPLGEVWYAEADGPAGPWRKAVKIASHPKYSFYNVRRHDFFDAEGGRFVYFEGTYSQTFSGAPAATPRYDYNQILYRLDLADPRLADARE